MHGVRLMSIFNLNLVLFVMNVSCHFLGLDSKLIQWLGGLLGEGVSLGSKFSPSTPPGSLLATWDMEQLRAMTMA